jgi:hypothetical protein
MPTSSPPSDPRLRLYRFVFEHVRDPTIVYDADGRPILLNRAARDLPRDVVERLFATDVGHSAELASFRTELKAHGHAHVQLSVHGHPMAIDARAHGEQHIVTVRSLGEREAPHPRPVKVDAVLTALKTLVTRVAGSDVEVELELDAPESSAMLDREHLEHAILNLTANARDAMPRGGRFTLRTAFVSFDASEASALDGATAGAYVALHATDTGVGMNSNVREQLFETFVTGAPRSEPRAEPEGGAAVGLAAVRRFVAESGGCMAVHSEEKRGTTVALYFPAIPPAYRQTH